MPPYSAYSFILDKDIFDPTRNVVFVELGHVDPSITEYVADTLDMDQLCKDTGLPWDALLSEDVYEVFDMSASDLRTLLTGLGMHEIKRMDEEEGAD